MGLNRFTISSLAIALASLSAGGAAAQNDVMGLPHAKSWCIAYDKQMPISHDDETEMTQLVLPVLDENEQVVTAINLADARRQPYPACEANILDATPPPQTDNVDMS